MQERIINLLLTIIGCCVVFYIFKQNHEITYLKDTIKLQHEAIERQNVLIDFQKRIMYSNNPQNEFQPTYK